jgi:hypothetical protein
VILDYSSFSLEKFIRKNVEQGSIFVTDSLASYPPILKDHNHAAVNQRKETNSRESFYGVRLITSLLKRLIRGTYQGRFEPKKLQNYLDEYVFRFN